MVAFGPGNAEIYGETVVLVPSGTRTTAGSGGTVATGSADTVRLTLAVTAASGTTPSTTVSVQHSSDGTTWTTVGSFTAATGVTSERKTFGALDRYVRASWTMTGTTPSFTFSVLGELV